MLLRESRAQDAFRELPLLESHGCASGIGCLWTLTLLPGTHGPSVDTVTILTLPEFTTNQKDCHSFSASMLQIRALHSLFFPWEKKKKRCSRAGLPNNKWPIGKYPRNVRICPCYSLRTITFQNIGIFEFLPYLSNLSLCSVYNLYEESNFYGIDLPMSSLHSSNNSIFACPCFLSLSEVLVWDVKNVFCWGKNRSLVR